MIRQAIDAANPDWLRTATVVPTPPSTTKAYPEYHDRLLKIIQLAGAALNLDTRELLVLTKDLATAHLVEDSAKR